MANILAKAVKQTARGFDQERKKVFPPNSWVALLAADRTPGAGGFKQLRLYRKGFIPRSNNFRTGFYIEIATADDLTLDILKTAYFALGKNSPTGMVYSVSNGDVFEPSGDRFSWMIYGTFTKNTYTPPV